MPVVAFPGFIVVPDHADILLHISQAVFETVARAGKRMGNQPRRHLDKPRFVEMELLFEDEHRLNVVGRDNMISIVVKFDNICAKGFLDIAVIRTQIPAFAGKVETNVEDDFCKGILQPPLARRHALFSPVLHPSASNVLVESIVLICFVPVF